MKGLTLMVIMLYFHCKIVNNINYPGSNPPNPGLGPRVNLGFGFEKPAGCRVYGPRGPGFGSPSSMLNHPGYSVIEF
jgi:hypothetical protein